MPPERPSPRRIEPSRPVEIESSANPPRRAPAPIARQLHENLGATQGRRSEHRLMEASKAFERERYADALKTARQILDDVPDLAAARELAGLCLYRLERWPAAVRELERFVELTGSTEQHAVLADCHRALRHYDRVAELWAELAAESPSGPLVAEGRIVAAGALADQGNYRDAIALLERAPLVTKRPKDHHVRLWYALADLYERAGDVSRARALFLRVVAANPEFVDAAERAAALGSQE